MGIPTHKMPLLFQPFSQVDDSSTRQFGGTGLGLSIVKSLAHLMNGEVGVDSKEGEGAHFWFRLRLDIMTDALDLSELDNVPVPNSLHYKPRMGCQEWFWWWRTTP